MSFLTTAFRDRVAADAARFVEPLADLTTRLTEVPAPTGDEGPRSELLATLLRDEGFDAVEIDHLHDVTARIPGNQRSLAVLVAAHTDTVFPHGVDVGVRREGNRLHAPGIGDNTISVAAVVLLKRMLTHFDVQPEVDIIVTGNVGEEGLGDLRGMRAVMDANADVGAAIALEGHALGSVTHIGVGSRRLEIAVTGPGGHSWGAYGRPSAIHAAAKIVTGLDALELPTDPKTTLNVGLFHGGISVNTIAPTATLVLDMRSIEQDVLERLVDDANRIIQSVVTNEVSVSVSVVGDRPAGRLPHDAGAARLATEALTLLGLDPVFHASSTDANIPISRGIPSVCIGLASGGNVHREDEYIDLDPVPTGIAQLLMVTLEAARLLRSGQL